MIKRASLLLGCAVASVASLALADDEYTAVVTKDPPGDMVSKEIAAQLSPTGVKVLRGPKRTVAEIWTAKAWPTKPDFKPSGSVLYPFEVGQLMGVVRFRRKTNDFKDQEIGSHVYTLRYGLQPVDGNHVGTSDTRDFLLMLPADADITPANMPEKEMFKLSAKAAESKHPAIMSLVKPQGDAGKLPAVRHIEDHDWWVVRLAADPAADTSQPGAVIDVVVAGKGGEH